MSGLYVDSSAALKRIFHEDGTERVISILRERILAGDIVATSGLTWVEVSRALRRSTVEDVAANTERALSGIAEMPLEDEVLRRARAIGPPHLRTLDAIHLATAVLLGSTQLLTYDDRLADAASHLGISPVY